MKKLLIFIILAVLSPFIVEASLFLSPSSINMENEMGIQSSRVFDIKNNENISFYDVKFSQNPYCSFTSIERLDPNETKRITMNCVTNSIFTTQNYNIILSGKYYKPISLTPIDFYIDLNENSVSPTSITIKQGDRVNFRNNDDDHCIIESLYFNFDIPAGQTRQTSLNDIGNIYFRHLPSLIGGHIIVQNNTGLELVHSGFYDSVLVLSISSKHTETSLSLNLINTDFNVSINSNTDGLLQVTNTGSETAYSIHIIDSKGWITFNANDFTLAPGTNRNIGYTITPSVLDSSETGKIHIVDIIVNSENTGTIIKNINVFIPYEEFVVPGNVSEMSPEEIDAYIQKLLDIIIQLNKLKSSENQTIVIQESEIGVNFTSADYKALFKQLSDLGILKGNVGDLILRMESLENITINSQQQSLSTDKEVKDFKDTFERYGIYTLLLIIILILLFVVLPMIRKGIRKKREGDYLEYE